jgi:hypothetical protein
MILKCRSMKRFHQFVILIVVIIILSPACGMGAKAYQEKRSLMLLENTQIGRNKMFYSKQNMKKIKSSYKKYHKNNSFR